jgi:hypothetical protein
MQPVSIAHWKIIKQAESKYNNIYVIVVEGISSSKEDKNFLSFLDRQEILKITGIKAKLIHSYSGYLPDIISNNNIDVSNGIAIIAGSDRISGYKNQFKNVDYKVIFDEIKRTGADVSASKIRNAIANDDYASYSKMIAPGLNNEKWFNLFKRALFLKKNESRHDEEPLLLEDVNTHIEHMEDLLFINNVSGIEKTLEYVKAVVSTLSQGSGAVIKTKYDGSPSVICGIDPDNGKFFVSTKGIFAKTPKVAYSEREIDEVFSAGAASKLKYAFRYLKKCISSGIYQGDLMFTNDKTIETIDGKKYVTFRPNTLTYAFDVNSNVAKEIMRAKVGIVMHGKYSGRIGNLSVSFNVNINEFNKSSDVWLVTPDIPTANIGLDKSDLNRVLGMISFVDSNKGKLSTIDDNIIPLLMRYKNVKIRNNQGISSGEKEYESFYNYVKDFYLTEISKLKKQDSKDSKTNIMNNILMKLEFLRNSFVTLFKMYNVIVGLKMIILRALNKLDATSIFVKTSDGYKTTNHEGFVAIGSSGGIIKLVDRLEFSRLNFNIDKLW